MIVTGGSNVYPSEVEEAINKVDGVSASSVIGLPHRIWGEEVTAVVVADRDRHLDPGFVRDQCRGRLPATRCRNESSSWMNCRPTPTARY
ncbi:AMP-binding enzyme [Rhodococcoides kyotonense]|uniref:AMP-binding enzyme n=1 Tax=Rhodococcoides kyotonense TaxID=398843 RepID=UPI00113015B1